MNLVESIRKDLDSLNEAPLELTNDPRMQEALEWKETVARGWAESIYDLNRDNWIENKVEEYMRMNEEEWADEWGYYESSEWPGLMDAYKRFD